MDNTKRAQPMHIIEIPEEETEKGTENVFDKIMAKSIPNLKRMQTDYSGTGSTECPKQDEPKQIQTETYQN